MVKIRRAGMKVHETSARQGPAGFGWLFMAVGIGVMIMMTLDPTGLNAPFWVAQIAASCFVFAGLSIVLQAAGAPLLARAAGVLTVFALATPGIWIMLGEGDMSCSSSMGFISGAISGFTSRQAGDLECRLVFGIGGIITVLVGFLALYSLLQFARKRNSGVAPDDPDQ